MANTNPLGPDKFPVSQQGQFTCFHLFLLLFATIVGIALGQHFAAKHGWIYGAMFGIVGCVAGLVIALGILWSFFSVVEWWVPNLPPCCNCHSLEYDWSKSTNEGSVYICQQCGSSYRLDDNGKKFVKMLPNGYTDSYMKMKGFRTWVQDHGNENQSSDEL